MPVLATECATGQRILHDVVEQTKAAVDFQLAVLHYVPCTAETRSDLVGETEGDRGSTFCISRQEFLIKADAKVECDALTESPSVLGIECVVVTGDIAANAIIGNSVIAPTSAATKAVDIGSVGRLVLGDDRIATSGYACRRSPW